MLLFHLYLHFYLILTHVVYPTLDWPLFVFVFVFFLTHVVYPTLGGWTLQVISGKERRDKREHIILQGRLYHHHHHETGERAYHTTKSTTTEHHRVQKTRRSTSYYKAASIGDSALLPPDFLGHHTSPWNRSASRDEKEEYGIGRS